MSNILKEEKEYQKKKKGYIQISNLNNDNIYAHFTDEQVKWIQKYYELYTKLLYSRLVGSLRLTVSKDKVEKLTKLKGKGSWDFAGMVDMMKRGAATCELGHPLRYVYIARNLENNETLFFGSRCVGDFFDLDPISLQALAKVKDEMMIELKELVAIMGLGLEFDYYKYEGKFIGKIINQHGLNGVNKLPDTNYKQLILGFLNLKLPLPKSLLVELEQFNNQFESLLTQSEFLGIESNKIEPLKNSDITLISHMFTFSEQGVKELLDKQNQDKPKSDFFNFTTINDLNTAAYIWTNRSQRLSKAQDYFRKSFKEDWASIYRCMIEEGLYRDEPNFYYGVEILMFFDKNIKIEYYTWFPKEYKYKGYKLSKQAQDNFDSIIEYMTYQNFFKMLGEANELVKQKRLKVENEEKAEKEMMNYLIENLPLSKYDDIKGIHGVRDIIINKGLNLDTMSPKQRTYIENIYQIMLKLDSRLSSMKSDQDKENQSNRPDSSNKLSNQGSQSLAADPDINNRYTLLEKPDILAKIQRLQSEAQDKLEEWQNSIIENVMRSKYVSDKQIIQIERAFSQYILGETPVQSQSQIGKNRLGSQKYNLLDRPEIKEKIEQLQAMPNYKEVPQGVQSIFENILKYKMMSEAQIQTVERTYYRYFKTN